MNWFVIGGQAMDRPKVCVVIATAVVISALLVNPGCNGVKYSRADEAKFLKPTIVIMSFENRAPVHTKWNLGDGLADQLIDRLIRTRRYVVLERQQLKALLQELKHANDKRFRQTAKPELGQLKHVRYLVKGTVTDFGHVETVEGLWRLFDWGLFGTSSHSVVALTLYVVDVQSGQVIASKSVEAKIRDKKNRDEKVEIDNAAFGSYTFYQTNLGRATNKALDKAVRSIASAIAEDPYQPKIASVLNGQVVINGGRNRMLNVDSEYTVRPRSQSVVDPDTGDLLGHISGKMLGRLRVVQVMEKYSIADIAEGSNFKAGQTLFLSSPETIKKPIASSSY